MMEQFTVTLPSNDSSVEDNTIASYEVRLPQDIRIEGRWLVGVQGISYTKSWFNLSEDCIVSIIRSDFQHSISPTIVRAGYYPNEETIVRKINEALRAMNIVHLKLPEVKFDQITRRASIDSGFDGKYQLYLDLSMELRSMLGLNYNYSTVEYQPELVDNETEVDVREIRIKGEADSFRHYDLQAGIRSIFLYSNIVSNSIVGSSFTSLLKVVPIPPEKKFGDQVDIDFSIIEYQPVNTTLLQTISILLNDDSGKVIPFKFGRTIVKLHFKKDESVRDLLSESSW